MEKEVIEKMARYVELSEKFTKSEREIFTQEELDNSQISDGGLYGISMGSSSICVGPYSNGIFLNGTVHIDGREVFIDEKGNVKAKDEKKPLTRGQQLEATAMLKAKTRAILLDDYDEYIKLRASLISYFCGVNKLINE